jgi:RNA polymerase sigma-70 factor (ECF subfamily)
MAAHQPAARGGRESDQTLLSRILAKDVDAFEDLYRLYHPRLTRFLSKQVHRPQMVEEVMNDTLMVVWDRAHTFNGASQLSTWIFGIAYRKAMKAMRRNEDPVEDPLADARVSAELTPEEALNQHRTQLLLLDAIAQLSPNHRTVVELTYFDEMGYKEIAAIMDCPVDTVKTRMFHARRNLKRHLAGEMADWL